MHNSDLIPFRLIHMGLTITDLFHLVTNDLENFISDDQSAQLKDLLSPFSDKNFPQEGMLAQYTIAKSFLNN